MHSKLGLVTADTRVPRIRRLRSSFALPRRPGTAVYDEARRMLRLYSDVAYGSAAIEASAAHSLRDFWALLSSTTPAIPDRMGATSGN